MSEIIERGRRFRKRLEQAAQFIPDENAVEFTDMYENWASNGVLYTAGKKLQRNGVLYKVLVTHESQPDWTPEDAPSLFAKVLVIPGEIREWEQPDSTNPYMKGDKVRHLNFIWTSDVDNNVWEPGVFGWTKDEGETASD